MSTSTFARLRLRLWTAFLLTFALAAPAARAEPIRLGGTGSALGTMQKLAEAFGRVQPQFALTIVPNLGSSGGLKALRDGLVQIAATSRPLKPEEAAAGLSAVEYGRTAFVLATSKAGVDGLSLAQVADIYSGRQSRWEDGTPIRLVLRPASDGDTALLGGFSAQVKEALAAAMSREGMVVAMTDQDSADGIERLPGGLGTSSLALLRAEGRRLHALAIDGVRPSVASVADGSYPHAKPMYLVTKGVASPSVAQFLAFVGSPEGRRILTETGHVLPPAHAAGAAAAR